MVHGVSFITYSALNTDELRAGEMPPGSIVHQYDYVRLNM